MVSSSANAASPRTLTPMPVPATTLRTFVYSRLRALDHKKIAARGYIATWFRVYETQVGINVAGIATTNPKHA